MQDSFLHSMKIQLKRDITLDYKEQHAALKYNAEDVFQHDPFEIKGHTHRLRQTSSLNFCLRSSLSYFPIAFSFMLFV